MVADSKKYFIQESEKIEFQTLPLAVFPHQPPEDGLLFDLETKEREYEL